MTPARLLAPLVLFGMVLVAAASSDGQPAVDLQSESAVLRGPFPLQVTPLRRVRATFTIERHSAPKDQPTEWVAFAPPAPPAGHRPAPGPDAKTDTVPPFAGAYHLETAPVSRIEGTQTSTIRTPGAPVRQWYVAVASPPVLPCQTETSAALSVDGRAVPDALQYDASPLRRPVLAIFGPPVTPAQTRAITLTLKVRALMHSRRLVPGPPEKPVAPLPASERSLWLRSSKCIDFDSPVFRSWLDARGLRRTRAETEVAFAHRVFEVIRTGWKYGGEPSKRPASMVCRTGISDCGGLSYLFVATLRANGVPARSLAGHWIVADRNPGGATHVRTEFFAAGVGWIPVEVTSPVYEKDTRSPAERWFGRDDGNHLVFHVDPDLVLDTPHPSQVSNEWLNGPIAWATTTSSSFCEYAKESSWDIRRSRP